MYISGRLNVAASLNANNSTNTNTNSNTVTYNGTVILREDIPTFLTLQNNATTSLDVVYSTTAANNLVADRINTQTNVVYINAINNLTLYSNAEIRSNGTTGGSFALSANSAQFDGTETIQTNGSNGPVGHIDIDVSQDINFDNSGLYTNGTTDSGSIRILSRAGNLSLFDSEIQTNGGNGRGGSIGISAFNNTILMNTAVEATGFTQGGHILIGSDAQNHTLPFSILTDLDANSSIKANQTNLLNQTNSGFIETSGHTVNLLASINAGRGGMWLLDPTNITIDSAYASNITTQLNAGTNVQVTADGYIDVATSIGENSNANLTISAGSYIWIYTGVKIWLNSTGSATTGTYTATSNTGSLLIGGLFYFFISEFKYWLSRFNLENKFCVLRKWWTFRWWLFSGCVCGLKWGC